MSLPGSPEPSSPARGARRKLWHLLGSSGDSSGGLQSEDLQQSAAAKTGQNSGSTASLESKQRGTTAPAASGLQRGPDAINVFRDETKTSQVDARMNKKSDDDYVSSSTLEFVKNEFVENENMDTTFGEIIDKIAADEVEPMTIGGFGNSSEFMISSEFSSSGDLASSSGLNLSVNTGVNQTLGTGGNSGNNANAEAFVKVNVAGRGRPMELNELVFVQCLRDGHRDAINVMEFSPEGMFLATGGKDCAVVIWRVLQYDKEQYEQTEPQAPCDVAGNTSGEPRGPKLFSSDPWQVLRKHTKEITCMSWSRSQFLLSGSADATVVLWHVQRDECLYIFRHRSPVTSVSFSPVSDLTFASGAEDRYVRVWSIEKGAVDHWSKFASGVQSLSFSGDAHMLLVGTDDGEVRFMRVDSKKGGLEFFTQIECRNRRGIQRKGKPVVGMQPCILGGSNEKNGAAQDAILVSTKDSRVRLCSMDSFACVCKFKGASSNTLNIKARIKSSGSHVISASEDKHVYVWNIMEQEPDGALANSKKLLGTVVKKCSAWENFQGHSAMVTQADFAPDKTLRVARNRKPPASSSPAKPLASAQSFYQQQQLQQQLQQQHQWVSALHGCIIVSADVHGHIHIFENVSTFKAEE